MIDEAPPGTHFYRMSINPDPATEDQRRDLDLRAVTERTILTLEEIVDKPVLYVAAEHEAHAENRRHVYLLASVPRRLNTPELKQLTAAATAACLAQRQERELRQPSREREDWALEPALEEDAWAW
jgi:hypothetical protein